MNGERFTLRWIGMFALLAALIALSPAIVQLLDRNAACFGTERACRDMAEVFTRHGRALILVVVLIPLAVTIAGRALTIGVFAWAFPFALLMLAGSLPLLYGFGGPGIASWEEAVADPSFVPLLFLLVLLLAMSVESEEGVGRAWQWLMPLVACATLFVTFTAWLPGVALMPYLGGTAQPVGQYLSEAHVALGIAPRIGSLVNTCLLAFVLAAAGMMMSARARSGHG